MRLAMQAAAFATLVAFVMGCEWTGHLIVCALR